MFCHAASCASPATCHEMSCNVMFRWLVVGGQWIADVPPASSRTLRSSGPGPLPASVPPPQRRKAPARPRIGSGAGSAGVRGDERGGMGIPSCFPVSAINLSLSLPFRSTPFRPPCRRFALCGGTLIRAYPARAPAPAGARVGAGAVCAPDCPRPREARTQDAPIPSAPQGLSRAGAHRSSLRTPPRPDPYRHQCSGMQAQFRIISDLANKPACRRLTGG